MPLLIALLVPLLALADTPQHKDAVQPAAVACSAPSDSDVSRFGADDTDTAAEVPKTPEEQAAEAAYRQYMQTLLKTLRTSVSARDRALSTPLEFMWDYLPGNHQPTPADHAERGARLRAAAANAPDDALVQWLWATANEEESGCSAKTPCRQRAQAVARLQPDNGSAWLLVFNDAWKAKDMPAAESALAQAALATRFDEQWGEALKAWMDLYRRYPMPTAPMNRSSNEPVYDANTINFTMASALTATMAIPGYQSVVMACSRDKSPAASKLRLHDCGQIGRNMLNHSSTLLSRLIGRSLLRVSGEATAADIATARVVAWQFEQNSKLSPMQYSPAEMGKNASDWLETGDEIQVVQRQLKRAGIALNPPPDWQPRGRNGKVISPLGEPPETRPGIR